LISNFLQLFLKVKFMLSILTLALHLTLSHQLIYRKNFLLIVCLAVMYNVVTFLFQSTVICMILDIFPLYFEVIERAQRDLALRLPCKIFLDICCIVHLSKTTLIYLCNRNIYCLLMTLKSFMPKILLTVAFCCSLI